MARTPKYKPAKLEPALLIIKNKKIPIKHFYENVLVYAINNGGGRISISGNDKDHEALVFIKEKVK